MKRQLHQPLTSDSKRVNKWKACFVLFFLISARKEVMNGQACSSEHAKNVVYLVSSLLTQTRPAAAHSKTDLTLDTCWSLLFDPFCASFNDGVAFYHAPDETGSLKLINLLQCCIFCFVFYVYVLIFYRTNVSIEEKKRAYQETSL